MSSRIIVGDCLDVMPTLDACSVDAIVCDPPYGLSFMGKDWDHGVPGEHFWREALRVAKPGAHLVAFGGTRTHHRLMCAIEDAGWQIRDTIGWLYGSGFPKSHNGPWGGTALKPAWEPIILARKPPAGTVAANVLQHGTGGLNIDDCRIAVDPSIDDSRLGGNGDWASDKMAKNVYEGGYAGERVGSSPLGRWPANIIHDGSDEVLAVFPKSDGQAGAITGNEPTANGFSGTVYGYGGTAGRPLSTPRGDTGSAARFFYCAKADREDRNASNHHPTVKPTDLMRYLCRLVTPAGGLILDPFCGSGSTGKAAILEGFRFIGIELSEEYAEIAKARIYGTAPLFAQELLA